jgi:hypothetical protein
MSSLKTRLDRLEKEAAPPTRGILVKPQLGPRSSPAGTIVAWSSGEGFSLTVPAEFAGNPMEGLDRRQRAFLRPGDRSITVARRARRDGGAR